MKIAHNLSFFWWGMAEEETGKWKKHRKKEPLVLPQTGSTMRSKETNRSHFFCPSVTNHVVSCLVGERKRSKVHKIREEKEEGKKFTADNIFGETSERGLRIAAALELKAREDRFHVFDICSCGGFAKCMNVLPIQVLVVCLTTTSPVPLRKTSLALKMLSFVKTVVMKRDRTQSMISFLDRAT